MSDAMFRQEMLGHGSIELLSHMGGDLDIINNAKVSFDRFMTREQFLADPAGSQKFIDFLVSKRHGSPVEAPEFKFRVKAPIFVMREWHRHRHAELNEESMRYSIKSDPHYYVPAREDLRQQVGKPGAYRFEPITDEVVITEALSKMELAQHFAFRTYRELVDMGVAKEQARTVIPVGMFSTMIWKANLRSIMNFVSLRGTIYNSDGTINEERTQAQQEIRVYADAMANMVGRVVPMAMDAFWRFGAVAP